MEKSLLVRTYIKIEDITDVDEDIFIEGKSKGRLTTSDILLIRSGKKKIKVTSLYCNYERLKMRFLSKA